MDYTEKNKRIRKMQNVIDFAVKELRKGTENLEKSLAICQFEIDQKLKEIAENENKSK